MFLLSIALGWPSLVTVPVRVFEPDQPRHKGPELFFLNPAELQCEDASRLAQVEEE